jgi:hypothetical protein
VVHLLLGLRGCIERRRIRILGLLLSSSSWSIYFFLVGLGVQTGVKTAMGEMNIYKVFVFCFVFRLGFVLLVA